MKRRCLLSIFLFSLSFCFTSCLMVSKIGIASVRETESIYDASIKPRGALRQKGKLYFAYGTPPIMFTSDDSDLCVHYQMYECGPITKKSSREILGTSEWVEYPVQLEGVIHMDGKREYFTINAKLHSPSTTGTIITGFSMQNPIRLMERKEFFREKQIEQNQMFFSNDDRNSCPNIDMELYGGYRIQSCISNERFIETRRGFGEDSKIVDSQPDYMFSLPFSNFYRPDQKFQLYRTKDNVVLAEWGWDEYRIFTVQSTLTTQQIKEYIALHQLYLEWYRLINSRSWWGLPNKGSGTFQAKRLVEFYGND